VSPRSTLHVCLSLALGLSASPAGARDAGLPAVPAAAASTPPAATLRAAPHQRYRGQIHVTVRGFRSDKGSVRVALFRNTTGFPVEPPKGTPSQTVPIEDGAAVAHFLNVAPGPFAISVLHDEDGDGQVGKSFFRIPTEGLGFSRNPKIRFGPPSFDECMVVLGQGKRESMTVALHYF
jgi:uncharacterized protein (DUF2141 family)